MDKLYNRLPGAEALDPPGSSPSDLSSSLSTRRIRHVHPRTGLDFRAMRIRWQ